MIWRMSAAAARTQERDDDRRDRGEGEQDDQQNAEGIHRRFFR